MYVYIPTDVEQASTFVQLDEVGKATSAAYTYYIRNVHDTMMRDNLRFYMQHRLHDPAHVVDLQQKEYQVVHPVTQVRQAHICTQTLYMDAVRAYDDGDYRRAIDRFQQTLQQFYQEIYNCRLMCDVDAEHPDLDLTHLYVADVTAMIVG
jgi:TolA-binding protein